jgi:hypothetical protein
MIGLVVAGVALVVTFMILRRPKSEEYRRFSSPDGRFQIAVFRIPTAFAMPGGSSDAPGYFQLVDTQTGRVLREQTVEMVQLADHVTWSATNVDVRLLADWSLPK